MQASTDAALQMLQKLQPLDGYRIEQRGGHSQVRLLRRNVPVVENYYLGLHYDATLGMVGLLTPPQGHNQKCQGQRLTDANGRPVSFRSTPVTVTLKTRGSIGGNDEEVPVLTHDQQLMLLKWSGLGLATLFALRLLVSALSGLAVLLVPCTVGYLCLTCPPSASFDAKQQLKRVLRGHYLPDDHPDKPKGWMRELLARAQATVTAEAATALAGYEETMYGMPFHTGWIVCLRVPAARQDFYWIGVNHNWYYVAACEMSGSTASQPPGARRL